MQLGLGGALGRAAQASALVLVACGGQSKSYVEGGTTTATAPSYLGVACGEAKPVNQSEVVLESRSPDCGGEGVCFRGKDVAAGAASSAGMCTCRCDGPTASTPFCSCGDGFECRVEVLAIGLLANDEIAGSYCVPEP